jgi:hypothetical protein
MLSWVRKRLQSKPVGYWTRTAGAILLGLGLGELAREHHLGLPWQYEVSRAVQFLQPRPEPRRTTVLVIEDDEYWRGSLARRVPIHRDYLAGLLRAVASCDPAPSVIALDFNLRSPVVSGDLRDRYGTLRDNCAYTEETADLAAAIEEVRHKTKVVLPLTVSLDKRFVEPSVLDGVPDVRGAVARGTIILPYDYRQVLTAEKIGGRPVPSFALAAADLADPGLAAKFAADTNRYDLSFIPPAKFAARHQVSYREDGTFPTPDECEKMQHQVVVVGGAWHMGAYHLGGVIDTRDSTPIGHAAGAAAGARRGTQAAPSRATTTWLATWRLANARRVSSSSSELSSTSRMALSLNSLPPLPARARRRPAPPGVGDQPPGIAEQQPENPGEQRQGEPQGDARAAAARQAAHRSRPGAGPEAVRTSRTLRSRPCSLKGFASSGASCGSKPRRQRISRL